MGLGAPTCGAVRHLRLASDAPVSSIDSVASQLGRASGWSVTETTSRLPIRRTVVKGRVEQSLLEIVEDIVDPPVEGTVMTTV